MHYIPKKIREMDEKLSTSTIEDPAAHLWDAVKIVKSAKSEDDMIDIFIAATDRKKKTPAVTKVVKQSIKELHKAGFLFKFGDTYVPVLNALNEE